MRGSSGPLKAPVYLFDFRNYLENSLKLGKATVKNRMAYAIKYEHLLNTWDLSELSGYSIDKRTHIMRAMSLLSKHRGCYNKWEKARQRYQLKWSNGTDSLAGFHNLVRSDNDYQQMIDQGIEVIQRYPQLSNIIRFSILIGLRPTESISSFNLLLESKEEYLSSDKKILQHFRYPSIFLRRTKKAYISLVSNNILSLAVNQRQQKYDTVRETLKDEEFKLSFCRKIFATFLRNEGVEAEIIDLLQGRIPNSIFVRHYYRPQLETVYNRVAGKLDKLNDLIRV
ncbi:MAG TPA: integrase [Candidatus Nitrosocosmicus sp.]|nr:integrase [Candidatus Nitrosocosmicus sp.]